MLFVYRRINIVFDLLNGEWNAAFSNPPFHDGLVKGSAPGWCLARAITRLGEPKNRLEGVKIARYRANDLDIWNDQGMWRVAWDAGSQVRIAVTLGMALQAAIDGIDAGYVRDTEELLRESGVTA